MLDRNSRTRRSGFTLIELMIVISIMGFLATIAVPAFSKYKVKAKMPEAYLGVREISNSQKMFFTENRFFLGISPVPYNATFGSQGFQKYWGVVGQWGNVMYEKYLLSNPFAAGKLMTWTFATAAGDESQWLLHYEHNLGSSYEIRESGNKGDLSTDMTGVFGSSMLLSMRFCFGWQGPNAGSGSNPTAGLTPTTMGVVPPSTGTYNWVYVIAQAGIEDEKCSYVAQLIEYRSEDVKDEFATHPLVNFQLDFSSGY